MSVKYHACPGCIPLPYFQSCLYFPYCSGLSSEPLNNQTWHIYRLLAFKAKLPKPAVQELKSPFSLPSPFCPPLAARALLHCPAQSAPGSPAGPITPPSLKGVCTMIPTKTCFCSQLYSVPFESAWTLLLCHLSLMEPQITQITPPLPQISSLQLPVLFGAFISPGCCTVLAEPLFSPNPLTLFCLVNAKDPGFFPGREGSSSA